MSASNAVNFLNLTAEWSIFIAGVFAWALSLMPMYIAACNIFTAINNAVIDLYARFNLTARARVVLFILVFLSRAIVLFCTWAAVIRVGAYVLSLMPS